MLKYKFDVLEALKAAGYSTYRIRTEKLLSESTVQKLREKQPIGWDNLNSLCKLLNCQPGDILEYKKEIPCE
jgi:putative transcriptional regulator